MLKYYESQNQCLAGTQSHLHFQITVATGCHAITVRYHDTVINICLFEAPLHARKTQAEQYLVLTGG